VIRYVVVVGALACLVASPDAVHACAACFDASDENRQAFVATTAFLTLLPLGMVTGAGLWLRRLARRDGLDGAPETDSDSARSERRPHE